MAGHNVDTAHNAFNICSVSKKMAGSSDSVTITSMPHTQHLASTAWISHALHSCPPATLCRHRPHWQRPGSPWPGWHQQHSAKGPVARHSTQLTLDGLGIETMVIERACIQQLSKLVCLSHQIGMTCHTVTHEFGTSLVECIIVSYMAEVVSHDMFYVGWLMPMPSKRLHLP